jgi:hypothetical protein
VSYITNPTIEYGSTLGYESAVFATPVTAPPLIPPVLVLGRIAFFPSGTRRYLTEKRNREMNEKNLLAVLDGRVTQVKPHAAIP